MLKTPELTCTSSLLELDTWHFSRKTGNFNILSGEVGSKTSHPETGQITYLPGILLAETEGDVEAVLLGDLAVELPHGGHAPLPAAAVHAPGLHRLQIGSAMGEFQCSMLWIWFLSSAANRLSSQVVQSRRRPLLGPYPG